MLSVDWSEVPQLETQRAKNQRGEVLAEGEWAFPTKIKLEGL